jgi:hypothetical protein
MVGLLILIHDAHGGIMDTARAELVVQGSMAAAVVVAFLIVHLRAGHLRAGHMRTGHLRTGHLRAGHLRGTSTPR